MQTCVLKIWQDKEIFQDMEMFQDLENQHQTIDNKWRKVIKKILETN